MMELLMSKRVRKDRQTNTDKIIYLSYHRIINKRSYKWESKFIMMKSQKIIIISSSKYSFNINKKAIRGHQWDAKIRLIKGFNCNSKLSRIMKNAAAVNLQSYTLQITKSNK